MADTQLVFNILAKDKNATQTFRKVAGAADNVADAASRTTRATAGIGGASARAAAMLGRLGPVGIGALAAVGGAAMQSSGAIVGIGVAGVAAAGSIAAAMGGIGLGLALAKQTQRGEKAFDKMGKSIKATLTDAAGPLIDVFVGLAPKISGLFKTLQPAISGFFEAAAPIVKMFSGQLLNAVRQLAPAFIQLATAGLQFFRGLAPFIPQIVSALLPALQMMAPIVARVALTLGQQLGQALLLILPLIANMALRFLPLLPGAFRAVTTVMLVVLHTINGLGIAFTLFLSVARAVASGVVAAVTWLGGAIANAASAIGSAVGRVIGWFRRLPGRIRGAVGNLGSLLWGAGRDLIAGMVRGLRSAMGWLRNAAWNAAKAAVNAAKRALWIGSPSKVMEAIGLDTGRGLAAGILGSQRMVASAASRVAGAAAVRPEVGTAGPEPMGAATARRGRGQTVTLEINSGGSRMDELLVEILRRSVRVRGGDVQTVLGGTR